MNKLIAESLGAVHTHTICLLNNKKENCINKNIDEKIVIEA